MFISAPKSALYFIMIFQLGLTSHDAHPMLFHSPGEESIAQFFGDLQPPVSVTLNVDDRQFHFMDLRNDSSTVIIFVHGSPGGWDAFMPYFRIPELREHFRLISVDRPGYGKSSFGKSEPSLKKQAATLSKVFDFLSPENKVILVGHSLGGPVIAQLAIDFSERIHALLFIAASMDPDLEKTKWIQHPAQ
jgi:pimeloyl-ACP methyl ester carboxylesterase